MDRKLTVSSGIYDTNIYIDNSAPNLYSPEKAILSIRLDQVEDLISKLQIYVPKKSEQVENGPSDTWDYTKLLSAQDFLYVYKQKRNPVSVEDGTVIQFNKNSEDIIVYFREGGQLLIKNLTELVGVTEDNLRANITTDKIDIVNVFSKSCNSMSFMAVSPDKK